MSAPGSLPPGFAELGDVSIIPQAWEEVREQVLRDPEVPGVVAVDQDRLQRLASLSIAELIRRSCEASEVSKEETDALLTCLSAFASHLAHLANQKRRFALYKGDPWWLNPSVLIVGPSGGNKGLTLTRFERSIRGVQMTQYLGRCTIQGLLGTVMPGKEHDDEPVPRFGALEDVADGVVLVDEAATLLFPQGAERSSINNLYELLWRGQSRVSLGSAKRGVQTWSIFIGALVNDSWKIDEQVQGGLIRRCIFVLMPNLPPAEVAKRELTAAKNVELDRALYAVVRAKFRVLVQALTSIDTLEFDGGEEGVVSWVAGRLGAGDIPQGHQPPFYALALGHYLIEMAEYSGLSGGVVVAPTPELRLVLDGQLACRRRLYADRESSNQERVREALERRLDGMKVGILCDLVEEISGEIGLGPKTVRELINKLVRDPDRRSVELVDEDLNSDDATEFGQPLRRLAAAEAHEWTVARGQKLDPPRLKRSSPRLILIRTGAEEKILSTWQSNRVKLLKALRPRPWDQ